MSEPTFPQLRTVAQTQQALGAAAASGTTVLLYFTAVWCGPCKKIKPTVAQLQSTYREQIQVFTVDLNEAEPALIDHFMISSVPTFVFVRTNQVIYVMRGADDSKLLEMTRVITNCTHPHLIGR